MKIDTFIFKMSVAWLFFLLQNKRDNYCFLVFEELIIKFHVEPYPLSPCHLPWNLDLTTLESPDNKTRSFRAKQRSLLYKEMECVTLGLDGDMHPDQGSLASSSSVTFSK